MKLTSGRITVLNISSMLVLWCMPVVVQARGLLFASTSDAAHADLLDTSGWKVDFAPYFWAPSVDGKSTVGPLTSNVDASFHDIVSHADVLGGMGHLNLQKGRLGLFVDGVYMDGSTDYVASSGNLSAKTTVDFRTSTVDFGAAYQVISLKEKSHVMSMSILGGGRYTNFKQTVGIAGLGPLGISQELGGTAEWIEPIVGGRARIGLLKDVSLWLYGDVGGFHVGYADLSWKARGVLAWKLSDHISLLGGYQAYGVDYSEGAGTSRNGFDGVFLGPIIGFNIQF